MSFLGLSPFFFSFIYFFLLSLVFVFSEFYFFLFLVFHFHNLLTEKRLFLSSKIYNNDSFYQVLDGCSLFFFLRQINFSPPVIRFKTCAAHCLLGFFFNFNLPLQDVFMPFCVCSLHYSFLAKSQQLLVYNNCSL